MKSRPVAQLQSARIGQAKRITCAMGFIAVGVLAQQASAGLIASNAGVPTVMNAGGTAEDVASYLYENAYSGSLSGMTVGNTTAHNRFDVSAGSVCTVTGTANIGNTGSTGHNTVRVTGAGSKMAVAALCVGNQSYDNSLVVEDGAQLVASSYHYFGLGDGSGRNALTINNGTYTGSATRVFFGGGYSNVLNVANGSWMYVRGIYVGPTNHLGNGFSFGNHALIAGTGTRLAANQSIWVGSDITSSNNSLTVANRALIQVDYGTAGSGPHSTYCLRTGAATNNFLRLAGGFAASKQRPDFLLASRILAWDGTTRAWVQGVEGVNYTKTTYATEQSALDATGYSGLNGYTVFAGGDLLTPPPPPATVLLLR